MATMRIQSAQEAEDAELKAALWKGGICTVLTIAGSATCFYALVVGSGMWCLIGFGFTLLGFVLGLYWIYKMAKERDEI